MKSALLLHENDGNLQKNSKIPPKVSFQIVVFALKSYNKPNKGEVLNDLYQPDLFK